MRESSAATFLRHIRDSCGLTPWLLGCKIKRRNDKVWLRKGIDPFLKYGRREC